MPLPDPIGKQREVVTLDHAGHIVVLGTAGSGKTSMAVHRAAFLANPGVAHSGRTLLLSYNRSLLAYLEYLRPPELANVDLLHYHRFARGYLKSRKRMPDRRCIVRNEDVRRLYLVRALAQIRAANPANEFLNRPVRFFVAETRWMSQHGLTTLEAYLAADRAGRGEDGRLLPGQRELMFAVYDAYRGLRAEDDMLFDWDDIACAVREEFAGDDSERYYRHIVVDEGQDFSPEMLRSLAAAMPAGGSLTVFADVAQQIYGRRISWRQAGLKIKAPWRFERNYRNSPEIAEVGLAIAAMPYYADEPDMVRPTEFAAKGPPPILARFDSADEEMQFVVEQAKEAAVSGSVGILLRRHQEEGAYQARLRGRAQVLEKHMANWSPDPGVSVGIVHNAKGYEFDTVILPGLSDERWPDPAKIDDEGQREAEAAAGRLLYVGVTRARNALIMSCVGEPTALLPENDGLWSEVTGAELAGLER